MRILPRLLALAGAGALALGVTTAASAGTHPIPRTIGCAVNPFCFDIYNTQVGPNDVLKTVGTPAAGDKVILAARSGSDASQDSLFIPVEQVTSVLNGDPINQPFADPNLDLLLIQFGDTQVFSQQDAPNGHLRQLYFGLNGKNQLSLQTAGAYGSQAYQNRLWIVSPFFQFDGSSPVINVGQTNLTGTIKVLGVKDGALVGARPHIETGQLDSLGQAPEFQTWDTEPNYP